MLLQCCLYDTKLHNINFHMCAEVIRHKTEAMWWQLGPLSVSVTSVQYGVLSSFLPGSFLPANSLSAGSGTLQHRNPRFFCYIHIPNILSIKYHNFSQHFSKNTHTHTYTHILYSIFLWMIIYQHSYVDNNPEWNLIPIKYYNNY